MPIDFRRLGASVVAVGVFASNIFFWGQGGYFDAAAELKPLLHTWSLSVEEQFYVLFPLFIVATLTAAPRRWPLWVALLAALSFATSLWQVEQSREAAFYLPAARAWEFLIGALVAAHKCVNPLRREVLESMSALGLMLIGYSFVAFTSETSFPGAAALLPCAGAGLIIYAGTNGQTTVGALLSWKPLTYLGRISYSLYLWHWPLIVYVGYYLGRRLSSGERWLLICGAIVLSALTWRFVEKPFRRGRTGLPGQAFFLVTASAMLMAITCGAVIYFTHGLPQRLPENVQQVAMGALDTDLGRSVCDRKTPADVRRGSVCEFGYDGVSPVSFAVIGDSIASSLIPGIERVAIEARAKGVILTRGGCYPLEGVTQGNECRDYVNAALNHISEHESIQTIIIVARWTSAAEGTRVGAFPAKDWYITDEFSLARSYDENKHVLVRALERTVLRLNGRRIFVVASIPEQRVDVPRTAALNRYFARDEEIALSRSQFEERQKFVRNTFPLLAEKLGFHLIDASMALCNDLQCPPIRNGLSLYSDDNHLSVTGARAIGYILRPAFTPLAAEVKNSVRAPGSGNDEIGVK
jgi:peptidoglycan/LPS O-acetylase OafA/YrhL